MKEEARIEMDNMLEEWAEKYHNEYTDAKEVEAQWDEALKNMLDNWSG